MGSKLLEIDFKFGFISHHCGTLFDQVFSCSILNNKMMMPFKLVVLNLVNDPH